jgi:hypothetical protein
MIKTKIRFSKKEKELIVNTDLILTKAEILNKVTLLMESLITEQRKILQQSFNSLPVEVLDNTPKISKGENYKGMPWRVLDYPRIFNKENICAIRTMFWWGNFFSITLHLSGSYKKKIEASITSSYPILKKKKIYYCINADQWQHDFDRNNYISLRGVKKEEFKKAVKGKDFIKLAKRISLKKWKQMPAILLGYFSLYTIILSGKHQLPNR